MTEPASLHPLIDLTTCTGCAACVRACPEQPRRPVLAMAEGKARLVDPANCLGHGACKAACPVGAIKLAFGGARRGVDIPAVSPSFESSVPGIYIAGELGGMGSIRNAFEQGRRAVESVARARRAGANALDLVIVGAGPAGLAASLAAVQHRLRFVTLEQESPAGVVFRNPRTRLVMGAPAELPLIGRMDFTHGSKEQLLAFWYAAEQRAGLNIRYRERVANIQSHERGFVVTSEQRSYATSTVLLAVGRRGSPRKLAIPGEELPKVVYQLADAEQYRGSSVAVVGGGDSALEAAVAIAEQPDTEVLLSYRGDAFDRARPANRLRVEAARRSGRLHVLLESIVTHIEPDSFCVDVKGRAVRARNDAVIICAGGMPAADLLRKVGLEVRMRYLAL